MFGQGRHEDFLTYWSDRVRAHNNDWVRSRATWELERIITALSFMEVFNTPEEQARLRTARAELRARKAKKGANK